MDHAERVRLWRERWNETLSELRSYKVGLGLCIELYCLNERRYLEVRCDDCKSKAHASRQKNKTAQNARVRKRRKKQRE